MANDTYAISRSAVGDYTNDHDTVSGDEDPEDVPRPGNSIVICTGANASGKSVYLKQCALIPYMAQVKLLRIHLIFIN